MLQFRLVSQHGDSAQVLLKHFDKNSQEITEKRETRHVLWDPHRKIWQDKEGLRYSFPPPEDTPAKQQRDRASHQERGQDFPTITAKLLKRIDSGCGVFQVKEADKPERVLKLVQIRGDLWRLAQGNKFFHLST